MAVKVKTTFGKMIDLAILNFIKSGGNGIAFGQLATYVTRFMSFSGDINTSKANATKLLLVNSSDELSVDSTLPPIYDNTGVIESKVVGVGTNRLSPLTSDSKSGYLINPKKEHLVNKFVIPKCYRWDADYGNGTHNIRCEVLGNPAFVAKNITPQVAINTGAVTGAVSMLRPGVPGLTANKEILVGEPGGLVARYKIIIEGDGAYPVLLAPDDVCYDVPLGDVNANQVVVGNMVYFLRGKTLYSYNAVTKELKSASVTSNDNSGLATDGTYIYTVWGYSSSVIRLYKYNLTTLANESYITITDKLPFAADRYNTRLGMVGDEFCIYSSAANIFVRFSDILDPKGSETSRTKDIGCNNLNGYIINGKVYKFILGIGSNIYRPSDDTGANVALNYIVYSIFMTREDWWGTLLSYVELDEPVTKDNTNFLEIAYSEGYK